MHQYRFSIIIFVSFLFLLQLSGTQYVNAQDIDLTANDTVLDPESFDLSQVSRKSAELTLKAKAIVRKAINEKELNRVKAKNEKVITFIDSLLYRESFVQMSSLSSRNLNGKLFYWKQNLQTVEEEQSELAGIFTDLNESVKYLEEELELWTRTDEMVSGEELAVAVHQRFEEVKIMIDTTKNVLDHKSADILEMLDIITRLQVEIETLISKIESVILDKQVSVFITDQPSLFTLNYFSKERWIIPESFKRYYSGNYIYFIDYMSKNIGLFILNIILFIVLIIVFRRINKLNLKIDKAEGAIYKKRLKTIISNPISAALIISLFASAIIYPYRPLLFLDISRILVTIPIVIVLNRMLPKKYHNYVSSFALLIILYVVFLNLPVNHVIARLILLFISVTLIIGFSHFFLQTRKSKEANRKNSNFITSIVYVLFAISIIGLIANLIGKVALASSANEVVLGVFLITIIIWFSVLVFNGLVVLLIDSKYGDRLNIIKHDKTRAKQKITRFFNIAAIIILVYFVLGVFKIQIGLYDWFTEFLIKERNIGSMVFTWGNIFVFFIVIYLSIVIANFIRNLLEEDILKRAKMKKGLPYTIALMVKYTLVTVGIFIAVSAAGIPTNSLTVILGAFGVGIGFGLQNIFNNLVSGLILLFERPIQIGDTIEVGQLMGNVRSIGIRSSNLRTFDGAEIIVPNGNLISNDVTNWTLSDDRRRIELIVGVSYASDPHNVKDILMKVIKKHPDIISDPKPSVWFQNLGESSLDFRMLFWTKEFDQWIRIKSEILFQVFDDLKAAGIEIPFPQTDLHLRSVDQNIKLKP